MLSHNSLRHTVHTHRASVHQAAKLVAALLRVARVTAGLAKSNGSLPPGLTAPRSRQITIPAPYHSDFSGRMPFVSIKSTESTCNIMALSSNNSNHINPNQNIKIMHQSDCTVITFSQTDQYDYFKPYLDTS